MRTLPKFTAPTLPPKPYVKPMLKRVLQRTLGFHGYLVAHAIFAAATMRLRREEGEIYRFIEQLPADATVLDVGMNVGTMTLLFARKCPRGTVFGFEPITDNFRAARSVSKLFRLENVVLLDYGLGECDENVRMVMPTSKGVPQEGLSFVVGERAMVEGVEYTARLRRLDGLAEFANRRIDAIKIDVEDHERFVLRGGRALIERDHPLIFAELWGERNKRECIGMLQSLGYAIVFSSRMNVLFQWTKTERSPFYLLAPE